MSDPPVHSSPPPPSPQPPAPDSAPLPPSSGSDERPWPLRFTGLPEVGWSPLSVLLGVLAAIGIMLAGTIPVAIADPEFDSTLAKDLSQLLVAVGLIGGAMIFALSDAGGRLRGALRQLGFRGIALRLVGLAALAWLVYVALAALAAPLLQPDQDDITNEIGGDDGSVLALVVAGFLIIVAAPVSEEIFFRGFMFAGLRRAMPLLPAAVISAAVWGSLHLTAGNVGVAIQLAIFGVVLAWLYERSGSLWAPILAHAINNTIAFVLLATDAI